MATSSPTYPSEWRTKLLTSRSGHGQSGWSPIGCAGFCTNLKSQVHSPVLESSDHFVGNSYAHYRYTFVNLKHPRHGITCSSDHPIFVGLYPQTIPDHQLVTCFHLADLAICRPSNDLSERTLSMSNGLVGGQSTSRQVISPR